MNAVVIDPFGWVSVDLVARTKGIPRQTLVDNCEKYKIPLQKFGRTLMVKPADIDRAIEHETTTGNGISEETPKRKVATAPSRGGGRIHRKAGAD